LFSDSIWKTYPQAGQPQSHLISLISCSTASRQWSLQYLSGAVTAHVQSLCSQMLMSVIVFSSLIVYRAGAVGGADGAGAAGAAGADTLMLMSLLGLVFSTPL
jgi:hypothetical protein